MTKRISKRKKNFKIGIDIDNVISDTYRALIERFNLSFGKNVVFEEVFEYYYLERHAGVEEEEVKLFIDKVLHHEEYALKFDPFEDAKKVIKSWAKQGYSIHYITARPKSAEKITRKWLQEHGLMFPEAALDLMDYESHERDTVFKREIVEREGIDILIEDSREIAWAVDIPCFLLDRPWNQGNLPKNVKRVRNFLEIENFVKNLQDERENL